MKEKLVEIDILDSGLAIDEAGCCIGNFPPFISCL